MNEHNVICGFDELFEDGAICGDTSYEPPIPDEDMIKMVMDVINNKHME